VLQPAEESLTSSEFERFLAERAAAGERAGSGDAAGSPPRGAAAAGATAAAGDRSRARHKKEEAEGELLGL